MTDYPIIDINMFVYNSEATVGAAIESVLAQTWPAWRLTIRDDGSTDRTPEIVARVAQSYPQIRIMRNRVNGGAVASFQRAFWHGDADFILPKSGDDLLAPDFISQIMAVFSEHLDTVMCHAAGLVFTGQSDVRALYPATHCLNAVGADRLARARHVMARYTSSPSFWGIYRRDAVDRLARIRYRAGWDHAFLAELALYGEIRHVSQPLYWRRDGGKPIRHLARAATERTGRGLDVDDPMTEPHWRTPIITTVLAHLETFAVARVTAAERDALWDGAIDIFRRRWLPAIQREAAGLRSAVPTMRAIAAATDGVVGKTWIRRQLDDLLHIVDLLLPDECQAATSPLRGGRVLAERVA